MFLRCSTNNLLQTVMELFLRAIENDMLWPSRIHLDYGVENVQVCDAKVKVRGEGRGSFIAGPSRRNQRIERLRRDVFRCVCHLFYYMFYALEDTGLLNIENPMDLFALHLTFISRINLAVDEYMEAFNHHKVRTGHHWSPYQMWVNGMLKEENPLAHGQLDEDPNDLEFYGVDRDGPSPFEDSHDNVVVPTVTLPVEYQSVQAKVLKQIDPLMSLTEMRIAITMLLFLQSHYESNISQFKQKFWSR